MEEYLRINKECYDILAKAYELRGKRPEQNESKAHESGNRILEMLRSYNIRNIQVLEIGPGAGQILQFFDEYGCRTTGVEISFEMAEIAKRKSPQSLIICQDINSVKFLKKQFHIIYMGAVLHLFPEKDASKLLHNIYDWLDNNGILYVNTTIHDISDEGYFEKEDYSPFCTRYRKYWTEVEFCNFVYKHGFDICDRGYSREPERKKQWVALYCRKQMKK